ncbi:MAG: DUF1963 domain-containing protein [Deltaproteobacteria bacterium]|nr:DUF1963 domain-containing protein [Deltaproteobacteria bacterium]MDQ3297996.1 YwqG family protein [Myxococcota bacterium]
MKELPFPTSIPAMKAPAAKAPVATQIAAFEKAVDIKPLYWTEKLSKGFSDEDTSRGINLMNSKPLSDQVRARLAVIEELAGRLAASGGDRKAVDALTKVLRDHACPRITVKVGEVVVANRGPKPALVEMVKWTARQAGWEHWKWVTGAKAVLALESPADAFKKLSPLLAKRDTAKNVLDALQLYDGEIDPRFFAAATKWLPHELHAPDSQHFLGKHRARPEVQALLVRELEVLAAAKGEPEWGYFYEMLRKAKIPGTLPALLKIVRRAAKRGKWRFTTPLSMIDELDDPAALPPLRELRDSLKGTSKSAVSAVIAKLEKQHPDAVAASAPAKGAKGTKGAKGAKAAKGTKVAKLAVPSVDAALAQRLSKAGLSDDRIGQILDHVRTRIELEPKRAKNPAVGTTRFGGEPDLPAKTAWPFVTMKKRDFVVSPDEYDEGTLPAADKQGRYHVPLAFIAQLDLADLAPHDADGLLPKTGMLWFFARQEVVIGERRDLQVIASHVRYVKHPGKLVRTAPPDTLPDRDHYEPAAVKLSHARPLPPSSIGAIRKLGLIDSETTAYEAVERKVTSPTHTALGWAIATYFAGIPEAKEQLLLCVGSDAVSGFGWGDDAPIFFCIPSAALAKQDFAKAYCLMDE